MPETKHTDTLHFSHVGEPIIDELVDRIESEGFDLTPGDQSQPDLLMDDLANALDSESYGRVAALVALAESIEESVDGDPACAERWRKASLPGRLFRKDRRPFTVIGSYDDNCQKWAETVWAKDAAHAEILVEAGAITGYEITVAGVIEGEHEVVA